VERLTWEVIILMSMMRTSRRITQPAKPVFSFVVDGECEYWYLQMLKDNEPLLKIHLSPEIYKKKTLKEQYKRVIELAKESEKVFWVIDFDVIYKETRETKAVKKPLQEIQELYNKCKKNEKIIVIVNNPCFEFWVLLHFCYTMRFYENYKILLPDLQKHLADYEKTEKYFVKTNPDIYKRLKSRLQTAISSSEKLGEFDFKNIEMGMAEMYKIFKILGKK
jgi:hypothetical protein